MVSKGSNPLTAINLLYIAGFLVMQLLAFLGLGYFILGLLLYLLGVGLSTRIKSAENLQSLGVATIGLLLLNLVFFVSHELLPFLDVSFALYLLLLGNLIFLNILLRRVSRKAVALPYWRQIGFFLIVIGASVLVAQEKKDAVYFFIINLAAVIFFYCVTNLMEQNRERLTSVVKWLSGLGILSSAFAVWQLYSDSFKFLIYPFLAVRDQEILELWEVVSRVVGTWQHPSYLGIYLAIAIPLGVYTLFYRSRGFFEKFFWTTGIVLMGATLLLTNTRSSVLSGFFGIALLYPCPG